MTAPKVMFQALIPDATRNLITNPSLGKVVTGPSAVAVDLGANGFDGIYDPQVILGGTRGQYFNGNEGVLQLLSADLASWFDGAEYSALIQGQPLNDAVWTDGVTRQYVGALADADNNFNINKNNTAERLRYVAENGAQTESLNNAGNTTAVLRTVGLTVSELVDNVEYYKDGGSIGSDSGLGVWAPVGFQSFNVGGLDSNSNVFLGWLKNFILAIAVATPANVATITTGLVGGTLSTSDLDGIFGGGNWAWWQMNEKPVHPEGWSEA